MPAARRTGLVLGVAGFAALGFGGTTWLLGQVFGSSHTAAGATAPAPQASPSGSPTPVADSAPAAVVQAFCQAVSAHELRHAWADLGGRNMVPSWTTFSTGYADTTNMSCAIGSVDGEQVSFRIVAVHSDDTATRFDAVYRVEGGVITAGTMKRA
ncbi:hypothetical protein [Streptacidiphilus anmyonensis]|uniref:hypothetical protein n=1 Tax=Streptacidiphilus anmyonensis TaxID=405782 RepID=UPI000A73ED0F|nr:hypothetical protein [Streptacidiphilus anmyonensis]